MDDIKLNWEGHTAVVQMCREPSNFLDPAFVARLVDALAGAAGESRCRSIVLASGSRAFSAGASFTAGEAGEVDPRPFYAHALKLFEIDKPVIAAVQGAAVGAGLGVALAADFRVTCTQARFSANFNRLGFHPGFGMTWLLPQLIGLQQAALLLYSGKRIDGEEAVRVGLADMLAPQDQVVVRALELAHDIAASAPLAIASTRAALRRTVAQQVRIANQQEIAVQLEHFQTADFREGVAAMAERRLPNFVGA
jgi:enoyl-CoA hydratase/carnithine racemase